MKSTTILYEQLNSGDLEGFYELFSKHQTSLEKYFRRKHPELNGQTLDFLHQALVKFAGRIGSSRNGEVVQRGKFVAYMKAIVEHLICDLFATASRRPRMRSLDDSRSGGGGLAMLASETRSPLSRLERDENLARVKEAYLALNPEDREIVTLWMMGVS